MSDVMQARARCRDVPVDERHRAKTAAQVAVHRVLRRQVVVADHLLAAGQPGPGGKVVELADQLGHAHQALRGPHISRLVRLPRDVAFDEAEDFSALLINAEVPRSPGAAMLLKVAQQAADKPGGAGCRAPHGRSHPHDGGHETPRHQLLRGAAAVTSHIGQSGPSDAEATVPGEISASQTPGVPLPGPSPPPRSTRLPCPGCVSRGPPGCVPARRRDPYDCSNAIGATATEIAASAPPSSLMAWTGSCTSAFTVWSAPSWRASSSFSSTRSTATTEAPKILAYCTAR